MVREFNPNGHENEHEALEQLLHSIIPEVVRDEVFGEHQQYKNVDSDGFSDEMILNAVEWNGPYKRRQKWLLMAGEVVYQTEQKREKQSLKSDGAEGLGSGSGYFSSKPSDINWQDCYNEAADAVAIYVDGASSAEAIKDGLRRQTFGDDISINIPREVLRRLVGRVRDRDDLTVDEIIADHYEAVETL
jgi:hypothetical protein